MTLKGATFSVSLEEEKMAFLRPKTFASFTKIYNLAKKPGNGSSL